MYIKGDSPSKRRGRFTVMIVLFALLIAIPLAVLVGIWLLSITDTRPPLVYEAVTENWELTYAFGIGNSSEHAKEDVNGRLRINHMGQCTYIDEIVSVRCEIDWGMIEPRNDTGFLDLESGLVYGENGLPLLNTLDRETSRPRQCDGEVTFYLRDGQERTLPLEWNLQYPSFSEFLKGL